MVADDRCSPLPTVLTAFTTTIHTRPTMLLSNVSSWPVWNAPVLPESYHSNVDGGLLSVVASTVSPVTYTRFKGDTVRFRGPSATQAKRFAVKTITVEPLLYDHPQNHIGVVVKEGWSLVRDSYTNRNHCPSHEVWSYERVGRW